MSADSFTRSTILACLSASLVFVIAAGGSSRADCLPMAGWRPESLAAFDDAMQDYMCDPDREIDAGVLAIAKDGKVVYLRAFGWKDEAHVQTLEPNAMMRVASVSKLITAAALRQLDQANSSFSVDTKAFNINGCRGGFLNLQPYFPSGGQPHAALCDVTISNLLTHTAGFPIPDGMGGGENQLIADYMDVDPPPGPVNIARWALSQPNYDPAFIGYRNVNYLFLGLIVEQLLGQPLGSYEGYMNWVQGNVLGPLHVPGSEVEQGQTVVEHAREPWYEWYGSAPSVFPPHPVVPIPYGQWHHEAGFSTGGLIASAHALAKFASHYALVDLDTPFPANWSAVGMEQAGGDAEGSGALPGTASAIRQFKDGISYAVLFNTNGTDDGFDPGLYPFTYQWTIRNVLDDLVLSLQSTQWPDTPALDCNGNGTDDLEEIWLAAHVLPATDLDANDNGYLDSCEDSCVEHGCDDGLPCTTDVCYALEGCAHVDTCSGDQLCNPGDGTCVDPFTVVYPNGEEVFFQDALTVQWEPGIGTSLVDISLSTDGGQTWVPKLSGTDNDGSAAISLGIQCPSQFHARIKVEGDDFSDVSDAGFTLLCACPATNGCDSHCLPQGTNCASDNSWNAACWNGYDALYCADESTIITETCDCVSPPPGGGGNQHLGLTCPGGQSHDWDCPLIPECPDESPCGADCYHGGECQSSDTGLTVCVRQDHSLFDCSHGQTVHLKTCDCVAGSGCPTEGWELSCE